MKKFLLILLILLALMLAAAPALGEGAEPLPGGTELSVDLDGDGAEEIVRWDMVPGDYEENMTLTVTLADGTALSYATEILWGEAAYVTDLDGDGAMEILLSGDVMSDDYYTWCLRCSDGALHEVLFPDSERGENTRGYFKSGYGGITAVGDGRVTLAGSQDVLGTWFASRTVELTPWERFEFSDDGLWVRAGAEADDADLWEYAALTVKSPVAYVDDRGAVGALEPGDRILVYASDKEENAWFKTREGVSGRLAISPDYERGWGWLVDGVKEDDCFEFIPYAD